MQGRERERRIIWQRRWRKKPSTPSGGLIFSPQYTIKSGIERASRLAWHLFALSLPAQWMSTDICISLTVGVANSSPAEIPIARYVNYVLRRHLGGNWLWDWWIYKPQNDGAHKDGARPDVAETYRNCHIFPRNSYLHRRGVILVCFVCCLVKVPTFKLGKIAWTHTCARAWPKRTGSQDSRIRNSD